MNIVVGVIVENTLQAAKNNDAKMLARMDKKLERNLVRFGLVPLRALLASLVAGRNIPMFFRTPS